jgi:hypothetical protein
MPGLRPLGLGEILDVGIKLYLRHWRTLMLCVVWVVLPVQIISVLVLLSVAPESLDITAQESGVTPEEEDTFLASQAVVALLQGLVYLLSTAACFKAVADAYLGGEPSASRSLAFGLQRLPGLIAMTIVYAIGLVLGFVALIVPSIWLAVAWSLAIPALLFERAGPVRSLKRSFQLVRGRWWRVALTLVVGVLLVSLVGGVLEGILLAVPALLADGNDVVVAFANVVAGTVGSVLTTPFTAAVVALVYFDQRVRKEGFDLQLLAEGLGREHDPDAPLPAPLLEPEITDEQRAQAPYWPPPPGWTPPQPAGREAPSGWEPPTAARGREPERDDSPAPPKSGAGPAGREPERDDSPAPPEQRPWEPPQSPTRPPAPPERGPGDS